MTTTTGTGRGAVTDGHTGWDCPNGASLLASVTGPGRGTLPAHHGVIYVCPDHRAQAEARITAAGHQPDTEPAPPGHRWDPWPCGHITTYGPDGPQLAAALAIPAPDPATNQEDTVTATTTDTATYYRWQTTAVRILADLIRDGQTAGLPPLDWTLATTGALTGEASVLDGTDSQRAALAAWARHLGATVTETPRNDGRVSLTAPFDRNGERRGILRAELHPEE